MTQFIIPGLIAVIAIVAIVLIIMRHMAQVAALDLESLPSEQEAAMKAALLERRLKRKMGEWKNWVAPMFRRFFKAFGSLFNRLHERVAQLEQHYRRKPQFMSAGQQQDVRQTIRTLFAQAKEAMVKQEWAEAEKKHIEILSWDPKHGQAYLGLAEVFLAKKEFVQAKETFQFFFKLTKAQKAGEEQVSLFSESISEEDLQLAHFDYAQALQAIGDNTSAREQVESALKLDANNPKYLDKLVELSILLNDRAKAQAALEKLTAVNAENQKLAEFQEQIKQL